MISGGMAAMLAAAGGGVANAGRATTRPWASGVGGEEFGKGGSAGGLDRFGHDVGEVARDAGAGGEQGIHQPLVGIDVAGDDVQQVVDAAAERPGGGDGVEAGD